MEKNESIFFLMAFAKPGELDLRFSHPYGARSLKINLGRDLRQRIQ